MLRKRGSMQAVERTWKHSAIPAILCGLFIIFFSTIYMINKEIWILWLFLLVLVFGIMFIAIGILYFVKNYSYNKKLAYLKENGICYGCSVIRMIPLYVRYENSLSNFCIEYSFNKDGIEKIDKSDDWVLHPVKDRVENLIANLYIDKDNPDDYALEIFRKEPIDED